MTYQELAYACAKAINQNKELFPFEPKISLKMPENKKYPKKRYLFGRKGPMGDVVAFGFDGQDTVIFSAIDVFAFLMAMGYIRQATPEEVIRLNQPEIIE